MILWCSRDLSRFSGSAKATPLDRVGEIHVVDDDGDQAVVTAEAKKFGVEAVVRLMDAVEVAASDRLFISVIDRRQTPDCFRRGRQRNP